MSIKTNIASQALMDDNATRTEDVRAPKNSTTEVSDLILDESVVRSELSKVSEELHLDELILPADYARDFQVNPLKGQPIIKKPSKDTFIRTKPMKDWAAVCTIEIKNGGGFYVVHPQLFDEPFIKEESMVSERFLVPTVDRSGEVFLWPLRMPGGLDRVDHWADSAIEIAKEAASSWTRVIADMNAGRYKGLIAQGTLPEPDWGSESSHELVERAVRGRVISNMQHSVIKNLKGIG